MKILLVTDTLLPGGAELFVLRLAQALHMKECDVRIFNLTPKAISTEQVNLICPHVPIISPSVQNLYIIKKIDSLLYRVGIDFSFLRKLQRKALERYCREERVDVVHSHLFTSDFVTAAATSSLDTKMIITIHGDYLQYPQKLANKEPIWFLNYFKKLGYILKHVHDIVIITDEQREVFESLLKKENTNNKIHKIYNGYAAMWKECKNLKRELNINESDFVFGMVARGIEEKGWNYLIEAFNLLNESKAHLVLVGSSDYLNELKAKNDNPRIHFPGFSTTPLEWVDIMDVGLFASYIKNEGLPTTIIEYLFLDKPVITTNVGECKKMITKDGQSAGFVVDLKNERPDTEQIASKMKVLMYDRELLHTFKRVAGLIKPHFDMVNCVNSYLEVYKRN